MATRTAVPRIRRAARRGARDQDERARRAAEQPRYLAWLARAGLVARGVMYVLIGVIAIQIAINGIASAGRPHRRRPAGRAHRRSDRSSCGCW